MSESRTYQITLSPKLARRVELAGRMAYVSTEELLLYFLCVGLRDHEVRGRQLPARPKILEKNKREKESEK
jgi:hypothetical protein